MEIYKILYFGTWGYGAAGLEGLLMCRNIEVVKVYSKWNININNPYLNKVYEICKKNNISIFNADKALCNKRQFEEDVLSNNNIDFIISCSFDRIFSKEILTMPKKLPINVHPSLLPKYRGVKPLENAIINGDNETGITIHVLTEELDAGDILIQSNPIKIFDLMRYKQLYEKQCQEIKITLKLFFNNVDYYINNKRKQNENEVSYAPRINMNFDDNETIIELRKKYLQANE